MNAEQLQRLGTQLEALLLASDEPLTMARMRGVFGEGVHSSDLREAIAALEAFYQDRGIQIIQVAGGWQFRTAPEHADMIQHLWEIRPQKLSRSAMETLAIIAYRQPTTRAEIEALRGVKISSQMVATLQERGWVKVLGRKEVPGRPYLLGTGKQFLVDFGLDSLKDLPDSAQLIDEDEIQQMVMGSIQEHDYEEEADTENPHQNERREARG